ncbi:MAG: hypothetical protein ONB23_02100 [candidate division KSB1 bacterium]|nr:hypothetical protein [candidate division KSB1 bacterium]
MDRYDLGTKLNHSYELLLSFWRQRFQLVFGSLEHTNSLFRKESPPKEFGPLNKLTVWGWAGEFAEKFNYGGAAFYIPLLTSRKIGRFSIGCAGLYGHAKGSIAHYQTYNYETTRSGSWRSPYYDLTDWNVTLSAWIVRSSLGLRYDFPLFPVSIETGLAGHVYLISTYKNIGDWEIDYTTGAGRFILNDRLYRERAFWQEPGIMVLDIYTSISVVLPL